ncbi:MAG: ClpX C4-type zinc finger protein [Bryobacteraceae bacterium]
MFRKHSGRDEPPRCSFCRKREDVAGELIASPSNDDPLASPCYICSECVAVCNSILDDRRHDQKGHNTAQNADERPVVLDRDAPHVVHDKVTTVRHSARWSDRLKF